MRSLAEFRAAVLQRAEEEGIMRPWSDAEREELGAAVLANIGKLPSQEAFDAVEAGMSDTVASIEAEPPR